MKPEDGRVVTKDEYIAFFLIAYGVLMPNEDIEQSAKMLAIEVCGVFVLFRSNVILKMRAHRALALLAAVAILFPLVGLRLRYILVALACRRDW